MNILKTTFASIVVAATMVPVLAQVAEARQSTKNLTCSQARNLVSSKGGIVLSTGRNTYDRFVASRYYCPVGDYAKRAYAPTRDRKSCSIGYICTMDNPRERWWN